MVFGLNVATRKIPMIVETIVGDTFLLNKIEDLLRFGSWPKA
jgi:hypothetical protein